MSNTCLYANDIDDYACAVYEKNWNDGTMHREDIRNVTTADVCRRGIPDVICGGVPCQDVSLAGKRAGLQEGNRTGLWFEMLRLVSDIRPKYCLVENVPGLINNGLGTILGTLSEIGYDAEWQTLSACMFGAPHTRERVWIVGYPKSIGEQRTYVFNKCITESSTPTRWLCKKTDVSVYGQVWHDTKNTILREIDGVSGQSHYGERLHALGNAIVPQVAQYVGECIMAHNGGEFTFAELFAGIGGFRLGFENGRYE